MAPLPSYDEALQRMLAAAAPLRHPVERTLDHAIGALLAEDIRADRPLPPFNRAAMDGYALRFDDLESGQPLRVVGRVDAGASPDVPINKGECVKIATGAAVPDQADTVVRHEWTDRGEPEVRIDAERVSRGDSIHRMGSDAAAGEIIIPCGSALTPLNCSAAAAVGLTRLNVTSRRPLVHVISSGDEVVDASTPLDRLAPQQIRDSNAIFLRLAIEAFEGVFGAGVHVDDDPDVTLQSLHNAMDAADVILTIGGVSAGARDHFPGALEKLGARRILRGAAIQPGKPIMCSLVDRDGADPTWIVSLPGNPVSVFATSHLFVWPLLRTLGGADASIPWMETTLRESVQPNPRRTQFRPALRDPNGVTVPQWMGSGDFIHCAQSDGLVELPLNDAAMPAGTPVRFLPWAWSSKQAAHS